MPIRGSLNAMAVFCIALAGCRPEGEPAPSPKDFQNESPDYPLSDTGTLQCSRSKDRSCLVGEVVARHSIVVGGYRFFDATDLGRQLEQVVLPVLDEEVDAGLVKVLADPPLTNETFASWFEIRVKGSRIMDTNADYRGRFRLDQLPSGTYDIRVQKNFTVFLEENPAEGVAAEDGPDRRQFCLTLFSEDISLFLEGRKSGHLIYENFRARIIRGDCPRDY